MRGTSQIGQEESKGCSVGVRKTIGNTGPQTSVIPDNEEKTKNKQTKKRNLEAGQSKQG